MIYESNESPIAGASHIMAARIEKAPTGLIEAKPPLSILTQIDPIDALFDGKYDGRVPLERLLKHGDHGLGTLQGLDGELVLVNGDFYQILGDGRVCIPKPRVTTPFASVVKFRGSQPVRIREGSTLEGIERAVDAVHPNKNTLCAVKVKASFARIRVRSVYKQSRPYRPLVDVVKEQSLFEYREIAGTLVGFRCPPFVKGVNVPGYHLHFISDDRTKGGHLLECDVEEGEVEVDACSGFLLILTDADDEFGSIDFSIDRSQDLERIERGIPLHH